jgi:hypothetical protein
MFHVTMQVKEKFEAYKQAQEAQQAQEQAPGEGGPVASGAEGSGAGEGAAEGAGGEGEANGAQPPDVKQEQEEVAVS